MSPSDALKLVCQATIQKHHMLEKGDSLTVGISGGADSVALLHFLWSLCTQWNLTLTAAHLNHNLRGAESDRDEVFVRQLCQQLGIPLTVASLPVGQLAKERGLSVEECARVERYRFFDSLAQEPGAKIATAHTLDDNGETVLLNLTRGTALRGLCGIPPVRGHVIRPFLDCTREQVEAYCREHQLDFVTDSTNQSDAYTRNRLRHHVLPVLKALNPSVLPLLGAMTTSLRADADYLDSLAAEHLALSQLAGDCYNAVLLRRLPSPIRLRVLSQMLEKREIPVDRRRLEQVDQLMERSGQAQLSGLWLCRCKDDVLLFLPPPDKPLVWGPVPVALSFQEQRIQGPEGKILVAVPTNTRNYKKNINNWKKQFKNTIDCDRIGKIAELRQRLPGDRIRLLGRGCTKTVRKMYNEAGMSEAQRQRNLVLADENGPFWVEGFGVAEHAAAGPDTPFALTLEVRET